ncbi:MAG: CYTH domain-containing protein [Candidatus Falkowbacteria bacterium]
MQIEYEATFTDINKKESREKLKKIGARLIKPEFLQKRVVFNLPSGHEIKGGWLRVRDEGDKITMSLKIVDGNRIDDQKEIMLKINDFQSAILFLGIIGCEKKAYQETKRETWCINDVEICLDEWPFLEPLLEIEGSSEEAVKVVVEKLGFDYSLAKFCSADTIYSEKYGISEDVFNNQTPRICFDMENPFLNRN